ncbi:hypothetical protein AK830_g7395 [Neonectria ditissima]|uniref:RRM domain-containing protein n=1 Tax=Neonectria ditissima TaxID=78410 RepID=A0A0P7AX83_9HYPO|nr:hypothetical protein AK830_g7395 [Neonectria ditissima]
MSTRDFRPEQAAGLTIHLFNLHFQATKSDLEDLLKRLGFDECVFYWPDAPLSEWQQHKGWCRVRFVSKEATERARRVLPNASFNGRRLSIGSIHPVLKPASQMPAAPTKPLDALKSPPASVGTIMAHAAHSSSSLAQAMNTTASSPAPAPSLQRTEALKALRFTDFPAGWYYNPETPDLAEYLLMSRMRNLEVAYDEAVVNSRPMMTNNEDGEDVLRHQEIPSPATLNNNHASKTWIHVVKGEGKGQWHHPGMPTEKGHDRDSRKILKIEDVWSIDTPFLDTAYMFQRGIQISRQCDKFDWLPGQLLGDDLKARALISHSSTFIPPAQLNGKFDSATSRGHLPKFPRPGQVGPGWGDYDTFREWYLHGRQIKKSMVIKKEWKLADGPTLAFSPGADAAPGSQGQTVKIDPGSFKTSVATQPESLFEKMNPKNPAHTQVNRRGGNRGARGGQGVRGGNACPDTREQQSAQRQKALGW